MACHVTSIRFHWRVYRCIALVAAMMSRKHYRFLAQWCAHSNISDHRVAELCDFLKEDNRAFQRNVFMNAFAASKSEYNEYNKKLIERLGA